MDVLVFRIRGPFAHFRRVYTTTSASTYSFPPRTAVIGMVGAILGVERRSRAEHLEVLGDLNVSVVLEKPVRKTRIPVNFQSIKEKGRIQIPLEVIENPSYLLFVSEFHMIDDLEKMVKNKESVFTPYLGISEFLAVFEYVGRFESKRIDPPVEVHSVIPSSKVKIKPQKGVIYLKERATRSMDVMRNYLEHETYILRRDAKPILVEKGDVLSVGEWNIVWM